MSGRSLSSLTSAAIRDRILSRAETWAMLSPRDIIGIFASGLVSLLVSVGVGAGGMLLSVISRTLQTMTDGFSDSDVQPVESLPGCLVPARQLELRGKQE